MSEREFAAQPGAKRIHEELDLANVPIDESDPLTQMYLKARELFLERERRRARASDQVGPASVPVAALPPAGTPVPPCIERTRTFPEVMTIEQAAEYLQLHPQVVYRHVREGTLPGSRIGGRIRFKKSVLDRFLEEDAWASVKEFMDFIKQKKGGGAPAEPRLATPSRPARRFTADID